MDAVDVVGVVRDNPLPSGREFGVKDGADERVWSTTRRGFQTRDPDTKKGF